MDRPTFGIGGDRLHYNQLSTAELDELANKAPFLTYGPPKPPPPAQFVPAHVAFDKKVSPGILGILGILDWGFRGLSPGHLQKWYQ